MYDANLNGGPFDSADQRKQRIKIATQQELSLIIGKMSGIEARPY